jgi:hypothetical protein
VSGSASASATVPASYLNTAGAHVVHGRITDSLGNFTDYTTTITVNALPTASFANSGPVDLGSTATVSFSGAAGGSGSYTYSYDFDNNGTFEVANSASASATVPASYLSPAGPHVVHGRISDSLGGFTDYTTTITVNALPTATFTNGGAVDKGSSATVSFSGAAGGSGGYTYSYDFDNNGTFEVASSALASATVPASYLSTAGAHVVHGRITDSLGGFTDYTTTVTVNALPTATFTNSGAVDKGSSATVSFSGAAGGSGGYTYSYDFNNDGTFEVTGSAAATATVPASYLNTAGAHVVHGRITDSLGGFSDYTTTVTVNALPTATFSNGGAVDLGSSATVSFSGATGGSGGYTYSYDYNNDGTFEVSNSASASATVPASYLSTAGPHVVHGRITDSLGGFTDYTTTVTVNAALTATFANSGPVNEGGTATVSFSAQAGGSGGYTYSYDFGNTGTFQVTGSASASAAVPASLLAEGPATVTVRGRITDSLGGFTDFLTTLTVNDVAPKVTASTGLSALPGTSTSFSLGSFTDPGASDSPWAVTVNWGDSSTNTSFSLTTAGALTAAHTYASAGTYTAVVTVTNKDNLSGSANVSIAVTSASDYTAPFITTPFDKIPNFGAHPTVVSAHSGAWSSPTTWSTGAVPAAGAVVSIEPGTTVTYDANSTVALNTVIIQNGSQLAFRTDVNTQLTVVNLLVLQGGTLQVGTQASPVAANVTAQIVFADQAINTTTDPSQYGNGLIGLGTVTMYGHALTQSWISLAAGAHAGATTLTLAQPVSGWQVGDTLYLPDSSEPDVNHQVNGVAWTPMQEDVQLAGISADGLTLTLSSALQRDHLGIQNHAGQWFLPHVADETRNVIVQSQNATAGTRGYAMFTGRADVNIQYTRFHGLGRTLNSLPNDTTYDANGNVTQVGTNQENRNAVTFLHLMGPATIPSDGYQYTFVGNSVTCPCVAPMMPFRWAINIYDSDYGLIQNNVVTDWAGAGIIAPTGSETGNVISGNFVSSISGEGDRADSRNNKDLGFEGSGFWFGGFNNVVNNNVASDCNYAGFTYYGDRINNVKAPPSQGADYSQYVAISPTALPILSFANDQAYGPMSVGLTIWALGASFSQPYANMAPSTVANFTAWHVGQAYYGYESSKLTLSHLTALDDQALQNNSNNATVAVYFSDYLEDNYTIDHADIEGFQKGYDGSPNASGTITISNSYFQNVINVAIQTASGGGSNGLSNTLLPRTTLINNDVFAQIPNYQGGKTQLNIDMEFMTIQNQANVVVSDTVYVTSYNGVSGDNFQVYYNEQAANYVMPQTSSNGTTLVGSPVAGLTNAQNWAQYGIAIAGSVAPSTATTRAGVNGLVRPD